MKKKYYNRVCFIFEWANPVTGDIRTGRVKQSATIPNKGEKNVRARNIAKDTFRKWNGIPENEEIVTLDAVIID